jgi:hypothetical protein
VEISNRPLLIDHLMLGPNGHVNPFLEVKVISS